MMNDRYLFRAKRIDNGEWVQGYYTYYPCGFTSEDKVEHAIRDTHTSGDCNKIYFVDPLTICQCTGLKGIYEWDVFECDGEMYQIVFDQDDLVWWADGYGHQYIQLGEFKPSEIKVIGNIFDNPELLEQEE